MGFSKNIFIIAGSFVVLCIASFSIAQEKYIYETNRYGETIATNNPNSEAIGEINGFDIMPAKWIPYETKCKPCRNLTKQYNETMQDLFNAQGMIAKLKGEKNSSTIAGPNAAPPTPVKSENDAEDAAGLAAAMRFNELFFEHLPELERNFEQLKLTAQNLRIALQNCELQCVAKEKLDEPLVSLPSAPIIEDPALFIDWKGPYYEVCKDCRKLAEQLNGFYDIALANANVVNALKSRVAYLKAQLQITDIYTSLHLRDMERLKERLASGEKRFLTQAEADANKAKTKYYQDKIKDLRNQLKKAQKELEKALKEQEKIKNNFEKTLAKYNECIKKCPPQKNACPFPEEMFEGMTIGPNNEVGSSAQAAKEMRDKVTGAAKDAATKAIGNLLGFGGLGGGGSKGPKTDRDRTKGDFVRVSQGDTDLDIRAGWRDDELIVSTEIDETPGNGTFHAQWLEDQEGNIYLPTRYLIFKMYRDWKLTVSWTEDHYVNGEHVYHDEGQEITTGRDLLGTWTLFEGENAATNSIWGMLGFDTAAKGVKHIGAVYDIPPSAFPTDCQLRLVTHISEPDNDPVTTVPVVGNLFKHVDESRKKPETIVLIQPHIIENADE